MSNAPAVREMPSQEAPVVAALDRMSNEQIRYIANTDVVPRHLRGKPEAMLAVILKGRALGFDDIHSLSTINFIDGRAAMSAEAMIALVRSKGHSLRWELTPGEKCVATGKRKDTGDTGTVTWTMAMAREAGLASKDNWKRHGDTMLTWRAVSQLCRFLFGDILLGVSYTEDEAHEASERGRVTEAVADLPVIEETHVREEPLSSPSEAQLNRIASLEQRLGEGYRVTLKGVYGVEMASELSAEKAAEYEEVLRIALPPEESDEVVDRRAEGNAGAGAGGTGSPVRSDTSSDEPSAEGPSGSDEQPATDGDPGHAPGQGAAGAAEEPGQSAKEGDSPSAELPGEPGPDDEVVDGEVVEETQTDLVELAGSTIIPIGNYKDTPLRDIHDGWIEWALSPTGLSHLPEPFIEALEMWARERKPEVWEKVRGG